MSLHESMWFHTLLKIKNFAYETLATTRENMQQTLLEAFATITSTMLLLYKRSHEIYVISICYTNDKSIAEKMISFNIHIYFFFCILILLHNS